MKKEEVLYFPLSMYNLIKAVLDEDSQDRVFTAIIDYYFDGIEPSLSDEKESAVFESLRGRLDCMKRSSKSGA